MKGSLWVLALLCSVQAAERGEQVSLLQQDSDISFNPLIYVKDEDDRVAVALSYSDAMKYASQRVGNQEKTASSDPQSELFMTGDTFDNSRTDRTRLDIQAIAGPGLSWADLDEVPMLESGSSVQRRGSFALSDQDTYTDLSRAYRFSPGDVVPVALDTDEVVVESEDRQELTLVRLLGTVNRVQGDRYEYTDREGVPVLYTEDRYGDLRGDEVNNGLSDSIPLTLRAERPQFPAPISAIRDPEVVERTYPTSSLNLTTSTSKAEEILGETLVADDREQVPVYDSSSADPDMTGDRFDNKRTDRERLIIVTREREEEQSETPIPPFSPPITVEKVDIDNIESVDLTLISPFHEHGEQAILTTSVPFYADSPSDTMVGDLFNNRRTDRSKLSILRLSPQTPPPAPVPSPPPPTHTVTAARIHIEQLDIDEFAPEEQPRPEKPQIEAVLSSYDADDYVQPVKIDQDETPFAFSFYSDEDESSPIAPTITDQDETWTYSFSLSDSSPLSRLFTSKSFNKEMGIATDSKGERKAFTDLQQVPTYYSSDRKDFVGGDMFDNRRSDVTRLRVVLETGNSLRWQEGRSSNPGFLQ